MKKLYIPLFLFSAIGINCFAQEISKSRKEKQGDKYAFVYSFDKAIDSYNSSKDLSVEGKRSLAKSYYSLDQYVAAEEAYKNLLSDTAGIVETDYYNYAMTLKANGKYPEAAIWMEKYAAAKPNDKISKSFMEHKNDLPNLSKEDGKYSIEHLSLNSDAQDFGTCFYKNKVVFASSRVAENADDDKFNWNNKPFLDMYISEVNGPQLGTPEVFYKAMNTKRHDGTASFNKSGTFMAYTSNGKFDSDKKNVVGLQIWFSSFADDKWSDPVAFALNNESYSVGQPCLSADGNILYFTSDMPGGYGKADIYRTTKDASGIWSTPHNMGSVINTEKDEMFPFFAEEEEILLFASNGHFGLGGLDIFMVATCGNDVGKVYNAGVPLNSRNDDFAVIMDENTKKGYFSSDRAGGKGADDLYSVDFLKGLNAGKKILVLSKDIASNTLSNTYITLLDDKGTVLDTAITQGDARVCFLTETDKNLRVTGKKDNYNDGTTDVNTLGKEFVVNADVVLTMVPKMAETLPPIREEIIAKQKVVESVKEEIPVLDPIYFDVNKSDLRLDARKELDKIVKIMNKNPSMSIELGAYADCRSSKDYNQKLSDRRARTSAAYIQKGIKGKGRVVARGYGEGELTNNCGCENEVVSYCSDEEHQMNRRTEFIVLKK